MSPALLLQFSVTGYALCRLGNAFALLKVAIVVTMSWLRLASRARQDSFRYCRQTRTNGHPLARWPFCALLSRLTRRGAGAFTHRATLLVRWVGGPQTPPKRATFALLAGACTVSPCQSGAVLAPHSVLCGASLRSLRVPTPLRVALHCLPFLAFPSPCTSLRLCLRSGAVCSGVWAFPKHPTKVGLFVSCVRVAHTPRGAHLALGSLTLARGVQCAVLLFFSPPPARLKAGARIG